MSVKAQLRELAVEIVGAGATASSATLSLMNDPKSGNVSVSGAGLKAVDALAEQFWEGARYVHSAGPKATKGEMLLKLTSAGLNIPDLADGNSVVTTSLQCAADVAELSLDTGMIVAKAGTGVGMVAAAVQAASWVAQAYSTGVSCAKAGTTAANSVSRLSRDAIKQLGQIKGRIMTSVNRFILKASSDMAREYSPSRLNFSAMPKPAYDQLFVGLLKKMEMCEASDPIAQLRMLVSNSVSPESSKEIATAVVILNRGAPFDAPMQPNHQRDIEQLAKIYVGLSLPSAFSQFLNEGGGRFQSLVSTRD